MQQQIPVKFHPDRSTVRRLAAEKPVFLPIIEESYACPSVKGGVV